ncbi:MAG: 50S ribosomal protein L7ae [Ruminococcaceae bacterium]|jgi:ribosomal protein L7Ae-like RNA K-turn-binding protein|nr:50S ribosomal protein L7ae [Oscillospiraceae bacterium]
MTERLIGLCRAAGGVTVGFDAVLNDVRAGRAKFVLVASDASDRTRKQLKDKCNYYKAPCFEGAWTSEKLAEMLGRRSGCVAAAFTGKGPYESVCRALSGSDPRPATECCDDRKDDV